MERKLQEELDLLKEQLLGMAAKVEANIGDAIRALRERDRELAEDVVRRDPEIDRDELRIDEHCFSLLALQQPVARDLRFITTAVKIVKDIERIGDIAANIAEHTLVLFGARSVNVPPELTEMGEAARDMLRDALDAFVNRDATLARKVRLDDDRVDDYHRRIIKQLIEQMLADPATIPIITHLMYVNKHLERIGDHSSNIAEMVVFLVEGKDIRHYEKLKDPGSSEM